MRYYSNTSRDMTLTGAIDTAVTSITVNDASGLPLQFPYNLAIDAGLSTVEIVEVTAAAGNTLTVVRGRQDTTAKAHTVGAVVYHAWTALDGQEAQNHFAASQNVHGIGGTAAVVGTDTSQTLTNKTINGANNTITNIPSSAIGSLEGSKITGVITVATIPADNVTGPYDNITVRQESGVSPALDVTANATSAAPNVRIGSDENQDAVQINRNSATTTGNLTHWRDHTGATLGYMNRSGNFLAGDINANGAIGALGGITSLAGIQGATVTSTGAVTAGTNFKIGTRNIDTETIRRFPTVADRTAAIPAPTTGMASWCDDRRTVDVYSSGQWRAVTGLGSIVATSTFNTTLATGASATITPWTVVAPPTDPACWTASGTNITCLIAGWYLIDVRVRLDTNLASGNIATGRMTLSIATSNDRGPYDGFIRSGFGDGNIQFTLPINAPAGEVFSVIVYSGNTSITFDQAEFMATRLS